MRLCGVARSVLPVLALALAVAAGRASAQSIITVAGGGSDDGRPATSVRLGEPCGLAVDASGTVYLSESYTNKVRRVETGGGAITTVAGNGFPGFSGDGGPARAAMLFYPCSLAFEVSGRLLVADVNNSRVRAIDLRLGTITTVAGGGTQSGPYGLGDGGPATAAVVNNPWGLAVDPAGNLYIATPGDHRVRRVDRATGLIDTFAGTGDAGFSGDGGPASAARLRFPRSLAFDGKGNLFIADMEANRIRRVDATTGIITTVAGDGTGATSEGLPATETGLSMPTSVAVGPTGDLFVSQSTGLFRIDASTGVIRQLGSFYNVTSIVARQSGDLLISTAFTGVVARVDVATGAGTVIAGGATAAVDDGLPATSAVLYLPWHAVVTPAGDLLIAERAASHVRKVDRRTGLISTFAGSGGSTGLGDGGPATRASVSWPSGLAVDAGGNAYIAAGGRIRKVDAVTGVITTVAGGGTTPAADGVPATRAQLDTPHRVAVAANGDLVFVDIFLYRVFRVRASDGTLAVVAGNGTRGSSGDGGPATQASFDYLFDVAIDRSGNVFVADLNSYRVRRIDATTGVVTTVVGGGTSSVLDRDVPAREVGIAPQGLAFAPDGSLWVIFDGSGSILRYDPATGLVRRVAGLLGFSAHGPASGGDGGPALEADLAQAEGITLDASGNLFVAQASGGRIRAVYACMTVTPPTLSFPGNGAASQATAVTLSWSAVPGAFRYDVFLDTANPPARLLVADLAYSTPTPITIPQGATTSYSVSNLLPGKTYYWRVVAKGDPFCPSVATAPSAVASFTTSGACAPPGPVALASPADGASNVAPGAVLSWQASAGAGSYDVYLGPSSPPPLAVSGVASTSFSANALTAGATYYWSVTARASCDGTKTTASAVRSFRVAGSCSPPGSFAPLSPSNGATSVSPSPTLSWTASAGASSYDLYLGTAAEPPLHLADVASTSVRVSGLSAGATYSWKVVAKSSCDAGRTATIPVQKFTVDGSCSVPGLPEFVFIPPGSVAAGQTYVVAWMDAPGLDPGGGYVVERSTSSSFATVLDSQATTGTSASFTSPGEGRYSHRVRAVPSCDTTRAGPWSSVRDVNVVSGTPDVVFAVQPSAVVTTLGERVDDNRKTTFTLENIGRTEITLQLGQQFLGPVAFFTVVDPLGGSVNGFKLPPRQPKLFEIRFQGVDAGVSAAYQGVVYALQANFQPLAITPFAFVNLKVGGGDTTAPAFKVGNVASEYAFFPGTAGDPSTRTLSVDVVNSGSSPMDLAAEVGPELWLVPEPGWNSSPIPPGGSRTVRLTTDRSRAPNGSALPRYTYLTVRSKTGQTARLLVQDNDAPVAGPERAPLAPSVRSFVVPSAVRATSKIQNTFVSKLRLSNAGSETVQAGLYFTPHDADGFSGAVRAATVLVPPGDVLTLTDPLVQLFGLTPPASGQLEVRTAPERAGFLSVSSSVDAPAVQGGTFGFQMPTVLRGEGARVGSPHVIPGISFTPRYRTNLILAETTGTDRAAVRVRLFDKEGNEKGNALLEVPRYGQTQVSVESLGAAGGLEGGRLVLAPEQGGGAVVGAVTVIDNTNDDASTYLGRREAGFESGSLLGRLSRQPLWAKAAGTVKVVVPSVVHGYPTFPGSTTPIFQSLIGFSSLSSSPATFDLTYVDLSSGKTHRKTVHVPGRSTREYPDALVELFGIPYDARSQGPVFVEASPNGLLHCKVFSILENGTLGDAFPVVSVPSESLTGQVSAKPLYVDGLEQSVDRTRGTRSNLILNEVTGRSPVTVTVRLYEPGNRSTPIAELDVPLGAGEKKQLSTVFSELGLDSADRRKDRTNVQCVVTAKAGAGLASAVVTTIDNRTGDTKNVLLTPAGSASAPGGITIGF